MKVTRTNSPSFVPVTLEVTVDTLEELKALRALFDGMGPHLAEKIADGASLCRVSAADVERVTRAIGLAAQDVLIQRGVF